MSGWRASPRVAPRTGPTSHAATHEVPCITAHEADGRRCAANSCRIARETCTIADLVGAQTFAASHSANARARAAAVDRNAASSGKEASAKRCEPRVRRLRIAHDPLARIYKPAIGIALTRTRAGFASSVHATITRLPSIAMRGNPLEREAVVSATVAERRGVS